LANLHRDVELCCLLCCRLTALHHVRELKAELQTLRSQTAEHLAQYAIRFNRVQCDPELHLSLCYVFLQRGAQFPGAAERSDARAAESDRKTPPPGQF
jgi:hypothetical protein